MEIVRLAGRKQARDARRRFLAEVQGGGMEYSALWKWILTIDESGDETVPSSVGMAWIRQNPILFARLVGNVSWFLRASMIECESGCVPGLAQWFFPDVLMSAEILAMLPGEDLDGAHTRYPEVGSNERDELWERLCVAYGATNSSWVGVAVGCGISGDTFASVFLQRLLLEGRSADPADWNTTHILLAAGPSDPCWLVRQALWEKLPDGLLAVALISCARRCPAEVLTVAWRASARFGLNVSRIIASSALEHLDEVPSIDSALALVTHEQRVDLANRLKPVRADSPKLGAATARFLALLATTFQPENQYGVWLQWSPVLDAVDQVVVYRAVREVVTAGDQIARHVRARLESAGYEVGIVEMVDVNGAPHAAIRCGRRTCLGRRAIGNGGYVPKTGDEVVCRPQGHVCLSESDDMYLVHFFPIVS